MRQIAIVTVVLVVASLSPAIAAEWTTPVPVTEINTDYYEEWSPFLSNDGLSLYFSRLRNLSPPSYGRIFEATRSTPSGPFTQITEVFSAPQGIHVTYPWVSPDELRMYYRVEDSSGWGLGFTQRDSVGDPWPQGTSITELNALGNYVGEPRLTSDELTIFFSRWIGGSYDIWTASRPDWNSPFANAKNVMEINTSANDKEASVSPDGLTMVFASDRGQLNTFSIYMATRQSTNDPFENVQHLSMFDTLGGGSNHPYLSADGTTLYYMKDLGLSSRDIYVSYYVPEPATIALLGLGTVMLRWRR